MDKIYGTEAARILGVSRSTMLRMADQKRLPPDGVEDDGTRYWHRQTILDHLAGRPKRSTYIFPRTSHLHGLCPNEKRFRLLVTGTVIPLDLEANTDGAAIIEVCHAISDRSAAGIGLDFAFMASPFFPTVAHYAAENGTSIILVPST